MSENIEQEVPLSSSQATTSLVSPNNTTNQFNASNAEEESSSNNSNVISIATREISDVIQFQEPSTSKNYSFKTQIRINILGEPKTSHRSIDSDDSMALTLFEENIDQAKFKLGSVEPEESYATVDACVKEKTTDTSDVIYFATNERTQRMIVVNTDAPPPYENQPPPAYSRRGYYGPPSQQQTYIQTVADASQGGAYYRNYDDNYYSGDFVFSDIRHAFIKKVLIILALQLSITAGFILLVMFHEPTKLFMLTNVVLFWVMAMVEMVLLITLMCYQTVRRIFPLNFILLLLFTIALSYICAFATIFYSTKVIVTTAASTALICFLVSILACQSWFDITKWSFIIALASIIMMVFGLVVMIVSIFIHSQVLWLVYSALATVLFTVYLLYDLQCILGGRRHEISPEEYIFAALTLYVDIIMIFMYMLEIMQACSH